MAGGGVAGLAVGGWVGAFVGIEGGFEVVVGFGEAVAVVAAVVEEEPKEWLPCYK
jgi:hypothetical protein